MEPRQPQPPDDKPQANVDRDGAPKKFSDAGGLPYTDEELRRYDEIAARLPTAKPRSRRRKR